MAYHTSGNPWYSCYHADYEVRKYLKHRFRADLPDEERPREKLLTLGAKALSNVELLAILLHSGTRKKSVFELSQEILAKCHKDYKTKFGK